MLYIPHNTNTAALAYRCCDVVMLCIGVVSYTAVLFVQQAAFFAYHGCVLLS
jgi:hypothetical protein